MAVSCQAEELVEEFHPGCSHAGFHALVDRLALALLSVEPDLGGGSRPHDHQFIPFYLTDKVLHCVKQSFLARAAVEFAEAFEAGHHLIGLGCPAHLPHRLVRQCFFNEMKSGRGEHVGTVPGLYDVPGEVEVALFSSPLVKQDYRFEHRAWGKSLPADPSRAGDVDSALRSGFPYQVVRR